MAKDKPATSAHNQHLHARISYLYQVSTFLSTLNPSSPTTANLSRFYNTTLRSVAKKSVIRLDPSVKRTICKRCDTLLVPGVSSTHRIENKSKNGRKSWADVLVIECKTCGAVKRFPVGMEERKRKNGKKWRLWSEGGPVEEGGGEQKNAGHSKENVSLHTTAELSPADCPEPKADTAMEELPSQALQYNDRE